MLLSDAILLAIFAALLGLVVGWALRAGADPCRPPDDEDNPPSVPPALALELRYADDALELARRALPEGDDAAHEALAGGLQRLLAEAWGHGASDLRGALAQYSGLPPDLIDSAASAALDALEAKR